VVFLPYDEAGNNPYQRQLTLALLRYGVHVHAAHPSSLILLRQFPTIWSAHVLHIHWPESHVLSAGSRVITLLRMAAMLGQLGFLRLMGRRIVCTLHNLRPHENPYPRLMHHYFRLLYRLAHGLIAHCPRAAQLAADSYRIRNRAKIRVIPHGHYVDWYPNQLTQADARRQLGLPPTACIFLSFGALRRYKAIRALIQEFRRRLSSRAILLIVGQPVDDATNEQVREAIGNDPAVVYHPVFVAPDDVQRYMNAADFVVCPQPDALTSGTLVLAMSFGRACVAPDVGCLGETLDSSGGTLYDPAQPDALADALVTAFARRDEAAEMGAHNLERARSWDWDAIARATWAVYADDPGGPL